ncbi:MULTISPECIES: hypothetical protein [Klebsiella]|uniref:hypothetical protein n=1 Tax=Klebsiella TaxID=570 RepID=UPI000C449813|nr:MULTISPECIES: hypothetical protein [Klebsiella]MBZ7457474.1 hypothetical protein [Klebsiella michiganensis]PHY98752.1 hypothetical protein CK204_19595 [Klebsiella pneumoniae]QSA79253.1 hypothetical protein JT748_19185 [Klebsiella pneumoniae]QTL14473.1 hypothetical protein J6255_19185 [Klebsiella pneumoniae]QVK28640.1 hypothetical protein KH752_07615 [Klebsiella pneumoniae]
MLDIAEVLKARESEFVSLRELVTRIRLHQPHVSESQIADFLYIEEANGDLPEWVKQGIAGTIEPTDTDNNYDGDPSLISLLKAIREEGYMPEVTPTLQAAQPVVSEPPMDFDDDIPF